MNVKEYFEELYPKEAGVERLLGKRFIIRFAEAYANHQNKQLIEALEKSVGLLKLIDDGVGFNEDLLHKVIREAEALQT